MFSETAVLMPLALIYLGFVIFVFFISRRMVGGGDGFSPLKMLCYFSMIEVFVLVWFSLDSAFVERSIFREIDSKFHQHDLVVYSYLLCIVVFFFKCFGVVLGSQTRKEPHSSYVLFNNATQAHRISSDNGAKKFMVIFGGALVLFYFFLMQIGGLASVWENINMRSTMTSGYGFLSIPYSILIGLSVSSLFVFFYKRNRVWSWLVLGVASLCLVSLGQRSPLAFMVFLTLIMFHYKVKPVKVANIKLLFVVICLLVFLFFFGKLRHVDVAPDGYDIVHSVERSVIKRLGSLERQIVTIGYFDQEEYWGSGLYNSLLYIFTSRLYASDKPPIDTGVYLYGISSGSTITPPLPAHSVPKTSWPDGYLAGYASYGFIGLFVICLASGFLFGWAYRVMRVSGYRESYVYMYSYIGYLGILPLSPLGMTRLVYVLIVISAVGWGLVVTGSLKASLAR